MATIEERAEKIAKKNARTYKVYCDYADKEGVYAFVSSTEECKKSAIDSATEQKAIDEERIAKLESFVERAMKLIEAEKAFREHLEAKEKKLIDKACEWLEKSLPDIEYITNASAYRQSKSEFIDTFRKAMEEEL